MTVMNSISFRQLQRMTVKQLLEMCPLTVTVDGESSFQLMKASQLKWETAPNLGHDPNNPFPLPKKEPVTFYKKSGEIRGDDYV